MRLTQNRGFTLIELLVVIVILAILSTIGYVTFAGVQKNARDTKRRQDVDALAKAITQYRSANGTYPGGACSADNAGDWPAAFKTAIAPYMSEIPKDPFNKGATWASQTGCPGQMSNGNNNCVYCFSPDMAYYNGTSGPTDQGVVWTYQEQCSNNNIGDGNRFGLTCPHFSRYIQPL